MKSSKDINMDTYNLSLITAKEDVLNPRTSTNWALFAYDGVTNRLRLADSGAGGVSELVHKLHPRRPLYGLCRVDQPKMAQTHIAMIIWVGKEVDDYRRAQCAAHVPSIKSFFKEAHFFLPASTLEDVTEERIVSVAYTVIAMIDREKARRVVRKEDREEIVGTNYKRTIAAAEIHKTLRENFWAQAEREEEARKEEERRRAAEDRRRRERERVLQERREAEERERRMNEKLKKIQEQRRLQDEADAEKLKQEQLIWAQQQKEFEEEMRFRFTHSESLEKAAEAAVLVSQRKQNPREFFRQLSLSSSDTPSNPPSPSPTVRSSTRRIHRSLTDAFIFTKSSSSSPSSPCSPKPLSPIFASSPTVHSPTALSQPQYTPSSPNSESAAISAGILTKVPRVESPSLTSGPRENFLSPSREQTAVSTLSGPMEVFSLPPSGPTMGYLSPSRAQKVASSIYTSGPMDVFPSPLGLGEVYPSNSSGPRVVSPSPPSGPREVFPSPPSGPTASSPFPPSGPTVGFTSPPRGLKVVSPLFPCGPRDFFPLTHSGPTVGFLSSPQGQELVSPLPHSGLMEVCPSPPSNQTVPDCELELHSSNPPHTPTPTPLSTSLSTSLQTCSPDNPNTSLTEIVKGFTFYPPPPQPTANLTTQSLVQPESEILAHPQTHTIGPALHSSVNDLDLTNNLGSNPAQVQPDTSPAVSFPVIPSAQPVPKPPSRPLPSLPAREFGSTEEEINERRDGEVTGEKEAWVTAQASIISIPEEEDDDAEKKGLEEEVQLIVENNRDMRKDMGKEELREKEEVMGKEEEKQEKVHGEEVEMLPSSNEKNEDIKAENVESKMVGEKDEGMKKEKEKLEKTENNPELWTATQVSMISIQAEESIDDEKKSSKFLNKRNEEAPDEKRELTEKKDYWKGGERQEEKEQGVIGMEEEKVQSERDGQMLPLNEEKYKGMEAENLDSKMVGENDEGMEEEEEKPEMTENEAEHWTATQTSMISIPNEDSVDGEAKDESRDPEENEMGRQKNNSEILNEIKERDKGASEAGGELTETKNNGKEGEGQKEKDQGVIGKEVEKQENIQSKKNRQMLPLSEEEYKSMEDENHESIMVEEMDEGMKVEEEKLEKAENEAEHWIATQTSVISIPKEESIDDKAKVESKENEAGRENNNSEILIEIKETGEEATGERKESSEKKNDGKEEEEKQEKLHSEMGRQMFMPSKEKNKGMTGENVVSKMVEERNEGMTEEEEKPGKTGEQENYPEHWIATQVSLISISEKELVGGEAEDEDKDLKDNEAGKWSDEEAVEAQEEECQEVKEQQVKIGEEKLEDERVAEIEIVKEDKEVRTLGKELSVSKEGNEKVRKEESNRKLVLIDRRTEVDANSGAAKSLMENKEKNAGLHQMQLEEEKEAKGREEEGDVHRKSLDTDWKETYDVKNTELTEKESSTKEDGQMDEARESPDDKEAERMENKEESQRKSESVANWENNKKNTEELAESEGSVELEINQGSPTGEEQHRNEVEVVEFLEGVTVNESPDVFETDEVITEALMIEAQSGGQTSPCDPSQTSQELEDPIPDVSCQEHIMNTNNVDRSSEEFATATDHVQSENCLTIEVEPNPSISDDQPGSLPVGLSENMAATILGSLATSFESSDTESTVFEEQHPPSPSKSSREFEDSSVDEPPKTEKACEAAREIEEVESKVESEEEEEKEGELTEEECESDELDYEPAEWHTAELKTRHISTDSIEQLRPENVGDELEDTDCTVSTDSNLQTSSSVQGVNDVDDGQDAFALLTDDKASYVEAQEPGFDFDSVEEATEHAFLPDIDVNLKVMDTVNISDTDNKVKAK